MASAADVLKQLHKDHGKEIAVLGALFTDVPRLPTGVFAVDLASGGGFPMGKVSIVYGPESSGKTNIVLLAIAQGQQLHPDKFAVFVDAENSYDPSWAEQLGVDNSRVILVNPDYAEQAVDIIEGFLYADDVFVVALDSVAALVTNNEVNSSAEKAVVGGASLTVGKLARKAVRAFMASKKKNNGFAPALICINQIRLKIGVMFGDPECLHADTLINFVDGRSIPIRQVVEQKIDAPIWAFNEDTQTFFESRILSHHYNGEAKDGDFLTVSAQGVDTKNGVFSATVSYTHKFLTSKGWTTAGQLQPEDLLLTKYRSVISGTVADFLAGSLVGDTTVTKANQGMSMGLRYQDNTNSEYMGWKAKLLSPFFNVTDHGPYQDVSPTYDIGKFSGPFLGRNPLAFFERFTWLGMAVWLMDDGYYDNNHRRYTLSIKRYKYDGTMQQAISAELNARGLGHGWNSGAVVFTVESSKTLAINCTPYFPECMNYKAPDKTVCAGDSLTLHNDGVKYLPTYTPVIAVNQASKRKYRQRGLYDLHIEGHHNYLAGNIDNGFVVHNTMPGGNALKFASGFTMRIYGKNVVDKKINETMPAFKETSIILKKWKMPILAINASYSMLMINANGKKAGNVDDWNTISNYLKSLEYLDKGPKGKGWIMFGETYPTLDACKEHLYGDHTLLHNTKQTIIKELMGQGAIEPQTEEIDDEVLESL